MPNKINIVRVEGDEILEILRTWLHQKLSPWITSPVNIAFDLKQIANNVKPGLLGTTRVP